MYVYSVVCMCVLVYKCVLVCLCIDGSFVCACVHTHTHTHTHTLVGCVMHVVGTVYRFTSSDSNWATWLYCDGYGRHNYL